jgi:hypothetical protein
MTTRKKPTTLQGISQLLRLLPGAIQDGCAVYRATVPGNELLRLLATTAPAGAPIRAKH